MKKDIEWAQKEVDRYLSYEGVSEARNALMFAKGVINQLDEPEVLSQEWIHENKEMYLINDTSENAVPDYKLQNLLVPKQEELESAIKVLIEAYKQEEGAYGELENGWIRGFIEDLKNLVEKEQKYHVTDGNDTLLCKSNGVVMTVGKLWAIGNEREAEYDLTEKEIKDYDERYWAFAKPVEELEG